MASDITLTSTTDTAEEVNAALAAKATVAAPTAAALAAPAPVAIAEPEPVAEPVSAAPVVVEEDEDVEASAPQAVGGKKRGKLQSRIDELVKERNEARGSSAVKDAEVLALRRRLDELIAVPASTSAVEPSLTPTEPEQQPKPDLKDFPDYEAYTEAVAEWKAEQIAEKKIAAYRTREKAETAAEQADLQRSSAVKQYEAGLVIARAKYDDYDAVVGRSDVKITPLMADGMLSSQVGPDLAYYLGKHPDEAQRLYNLGHSVNAIREFGKLEARVEALVQANTAAKTEELITVPAKTKPVAAVGPVPAGTKAPDPITPGGSGEAAATVPLDQMSYQDFKAVRNRQERERLGLR